MFSTFFLLVLRLEHCYEEFSFGCPIEKKGISMYE